MQVVVVGPPRSQADVKDTNWVTQRKPLAQKVPEDAAEGLLQDDRGCLLEGLVTNLFVVRTVPLPVSHQPLCCLYTCDTQSRATGRSAHRKWPDLKMARPLGA